MVLCHRADIVLLSYMCSSDAENLKGAYLIVFFDQVCPFLTTPLLLNSRGIPTLLQLYFIYTLIES